MCVQKRLRRAEKSASPSPSAERTVMQTNSSTAGFLERSGVWLSLPDASSPGNSSCRGHNTGNVPVSRVRPVPGGGRHVSELTRISISLESNLLEAFDRRNEGKGYATRSEAIRDLIRDRLVHEQSGVAAAGTEQVAVVTMVY